MRLQNRQKTDTLSVSRVALLCMATTLVVGFSNPKGRLEQPQALIMGEVLMEPVALARAQPVEPVFEPNAEIDTNQIQLPLRRPSSYATDSSLNSVLGQVSSRRWSRVSRYSPDYARSQLHNRIPGQFHGVGFPDIRTHRKPKHPQHVNVDPSTWNRMVSWRTPKGRVNVSEPIAHVRCMGLSPAAVARRADRYNELILSMAIEYDVSASLIKAVITEESCFNNKALSPVGAQGLMQLMPDTARWLKVRDSHDPEQNVRAGVRYLAMLQKQFNTLELALAAYNAGPGNVRRYNGVPPFAETRAYVRKVQAHYRRYSAATRLAAR